MKVLRRDDDWDPAGGRVRRICLRVAAAGAITTAVVGAASLVAPAPSPAGVSTSPGMAAERLAASPERAHLGTLEGRGHHLLIFATPDGPRYTALDALGNPIASDLTSDEVYRVSPDADVDRLISGPVMLADFD